MYVEYKTDNGRQKIWASLENDGIISWRIWPQAWSRSPLTVTFCSKNDNFQWDPSYFSWGMESVRLFSLSLPSFPKIMNTFFSMDGRRLCAEYGFLCFSFGSSRARASSLWRRAQNHLWSEIRGTVNTCIDTLECVYYIVHLYVSSGYSKDVAMSVSSSADRSGRRGTDGRIKINCKIPRGKSGGKCTNRILPLPYYSLWLIVL